MKEKQLIFSSPKSFIFQSLLFMLKTTQERYHDGNGESSGGHLLAAENLG